MKIEKAIKHLKQFHPMGSAIPLDVLRVGQRSLATLGKWDWSQVTAELVVSVPGKETGEINAARTGKTGLAACLRRRGWVPSNDQELVAEFQVFHPAEIETSSLTNRSVFTVSQSSSLTDFTINFMWNFYDCLRGKSATITARAVRPKPKSGERRVYPPIKVVFPTLRTVLQSLRGPDVSWFPTGNDALSLIELVMCHLVLTGRYDHVLHRKALVRADKEPVL